MRCPLASRCAGFVSTSAFSMNAFFSIPWRIMFILPMTQALPPVS